jgi:hypothetical protein
LRLVADALDATRLVRSPLAPRYQRMVFDTFAGETAGKVMVAVSP